MSFFSNQDGSLQQIPCQVCLEISNFWIKKCWSLRDPQRLDIRHRGFFFVCHIEKAMNFHGYFREMWTKSLPYFMSPNHQRIWQVTKRQVLQDDEPQASTIWLHPCPGAACSGLNHHLQSGSEDESMFTIHHVLLLASPFLLRWSTDEGFLFQVDIFWTSIVNPKTWLCKRTLLHMARTIGSPNCSTG